MTASGIWTSNLTLVSRIWTLDHGPSRGSTVQDRDSVVTDHSAVNFEVSVTAASVDVESCFEMPAGSCDRRVSCEYSCHPKRRGTQARPCPSVLRHRIRACFYDWSPFIVIVEAPFAGFIILSRSPRIRRDQRSVQEERRSGPSQRLPTPRSSTVPQASRLPKFWTNVGNSPLAARLGLGNNG